MGIGDGGLGIGDLGMGDGAQAPIPNPQSPIPILNINILFSEYIILIYYLISAKYLNYFKLFKY
jgi:hypothetical protein